MGYDCEPEVHQLRHHNGYWFRMECTQHGHLHTHWIDVTGNIAEARQVMADYWNAHLAEQKMIGA